MALASSIVTDLMHVVFLVFNILFIAAWIFALYRQSERHFKRFFFPALLIKLLAGWLLGWLYFEFYMGGDTVWYYDQGVKIADGTWQEIWCKIREPIMSRQSVRAVVFSRIVAGVLLLTKGNYWIVSIYFSLIAFTGACHLINSISKYESNKSIPLIISLCFVPSIVFWSSGVLKESLCFGAMMLLMSYYVLFKFQGKLKLSQLALASLAVGTLVFFKYYIAGVLVPVLVFLILQKKLSQYASSRGARAIIGGGLLILLMFAFMVASFPIFRQAEFIQALMSNRAEMLEFEGFTQLLSLNLDLAWPLLFAPFYHLYAGLFGPITMTDLGFPQAYMMLENVLLLGLMAWKVISDGIRVKWTAEVMAIVFYTLLLATLLAFFLPNYGTIARMRVYYMPLVWWWVLYAHPVFRVGKIR